MINESKEEVEYLMGKFYEYRILAAEAGANGADTEYKDFSDQAMEYYERAMGQMDADAAEAERNDKMVDDYEEDEANREMNKMDADMYRESKNNNEMNEVNLDRWAKIAGINENDNNAPVIKGNEDWEGHVAGLGEEGDPQVFAEMRDIILAKYPEEGSSTYRMEVYYNNNNEPTGANGGFAIDKGSVYFAFKFKDGKVVDYSFDEQKY
jgi:hypothetical protein